MALKPAKQASTNQRQFGNQPDMEPGTYPARVVQILDLGLQNQRSFIPGETKKPAHEVMLTYEFVDCFMVDEEGNEIEDKPRWFSETLPWYGVHIEKATSTKRYKALDADNAYDGDFAQVIGTPCNVTIAVVKKGEKTYVNITNVTGMRKRDADKTPELVNPTKVFDIDAPDLEVFNALPEWLRDKIKGNLNYAGSVLEKALAGNQEPEPKAETKKAKPAPEPKKEAAPEPEDEADESEENPW